MHDSAPYGDWDRSDVLPWIPTHIGRLLDVGCSFGAFGALVKRTRPELVVVGMEANVESAKLARRRLDEVWVGRYPEDVPQDTFDCIVFNDVLEHMVDPWGALLATHRILRPGGYVVASIPNVRMYEVVWPLLRRGTWNYHDSGILDRTHLRFFTKLTAQELFRSTGYVVEQVAPLNPRDWGRVGRVLRYAPRLTEEFRTRQYLIVARETSTEIGSMR
jgi:SAM-dependent methyltransferase